MGKIVNAMALSHAFAMRDPASWDQGREQNRRRYIERQGKEPPLLPELTAANPAHDAIRFEHIRAAQEKLRKDLAQAKPDVVILVGDDQNENLGSDLMPQIAVYTGGDYTARMRQSPNGRRYRADKNLSAKLLEAGVKRGFDIASIGSFADNTLMSHAHVQVLDALFPDGAPPTVLLFVNAIHHPAPEPSRCLALGELLADVIGDLPDNIRVAICGSGGMSHFTASYPWKSYAGPFTYGGISEDFDRKLMAELSAGEIEKIASLSSEDLLRHGEVEFRAWIVVAGAMRGAKTAMSVYQPFYRALMGMGVAAWPPAAA
jgi:hypothetical protein